MSAKRNGNGKRARRKDKQKFIVIGGKRISMSKTQRRALKYRMLWLDDVVVPSIFGEETESTPSKPNFHVDGNTWDDEDAPIDMSKEFEEIEQINIGGKYSPIFKGMGQPFPVKRSSSLQEDLRPPFDEGHNNPDMLNWPDDQSPRSLSSAELMSSNFDEYPTFVPKEAEEDGRISRAWSRPLNKNE